MLEELPGLHYPDDGGLKVHLPVLFDRVVSGLDLLRGLLLHGAGNPELGPLVCVLQVDGDGRVRAEALIVDVEQLGVQQGLNIPEKRISFHHSHALP